MLGGASESPPVSNFEKTWKNFGGDRLRLRPCASTFASASGGGGGAEAPPSPPETEACHTAWKTLNLKRQLKSCFLMFLKEVNEPHLKLVKICTLQFF